MAKYEQSVWLWEAYGVGSEEWRGGVEEESPSLFYSRLGFQVSPDYGFFIDISGHKRCHTCNSGALAIFLLIVLLDELGMSSCRKSNQTLIMSQSGDAVSSRSLPSVYCPIV